MIFHNDIYNFKVTCLIDGRDKPYRVIEIEKYKSLKNLAEAILGSFKFGCDHAFGFYDNLNSWIRSKVIYEHFVDLEDDYAAMDNAKSCDKSRIESVFKIGEPMLFLFDYGDEWRFKVQLVSQSEIKQGKTYPLTVEKFGKEPKQYG